MTILDPGPATVARLSTSQQSTGRRTALGRWITHADNPLTPRVIVNRLWHHHFGRGIVSTPGDFGRQGARPTHSELLDFLASELIRQGWSLKALHRLMLTSATYRQLSKVEASAEVLEVDPANQLLWRMRQRRLEAEAVRDAILCASGEINLTMGGPSVKPTLPPGIAESPLAWKPTKDPWERNRRTVYLYVRRRLRHPLLEAFDMPDSHTSCDHRSVTTTPLQALSLLNDLWSLERAQAFAARALREAGTDTERSWHFGQI